MHFPESKLYGTALVDSNSTRTESGVPICLDLEAKARSTPWKATDHNGYQEIIRPDRAMRAGLKIPGAFAGRFGVELMPNLKVFGFTTASIISRVS
ncbi:MAG: hypothetical protein WEG40_15940 [Candidatus Rokuibacteriota bacterium]